MCIDLAEQTRDFHRLCVVIIATRLQRLFAVARHRRRCQRHDRDMPSGTTGLDPARRFPEQPKDGLGLDSSSSSHKWRTLM
jgi:hypothetical protein